MSQFVPGGLGWSRDLSDLRDYAPATPAVAQTLAELAPLEETPDAVDWREFCPPPADQLDLPTGAAQAVAAMASCFERRASGALLRPSRAFLHQAAAWSSGGSPLQAVSLRATLKALVRFGAPPEALWPYGPERLTASPDLFLLGYSREFSAVSYLRLDAPRLASEALVGRVRSFLAAGFVVALGVSVFSSISRDADIGFPRRGDALLGGQVLLAVGYDDLRRVYSDRGALLVRSAWGENWGVEGCGWLPYAYLREGLAGDFWTLLRPDWLASGELSRPL